jgi:hypothetical protein
MTDLAALNAIPRTPLATNEPIKTYLPGSPERAELKARLASMAGERVEIPLIIGGKEIRTGKTATSVMPFKHAHVLADYHMASPEHVRQAIDAATAARRDWAGWPIEHRAAILLKAAELLATSWRATVNAATMLGQGKTVFQSEIDAACELIDFWRFNVQYAFELYSSTGYLGFAADTTDSYTGGTAFNSAGGTRQFSDNTLGPLATHGYDRTFVVALAPVPEPSTLVLLSLGGLVGVFHRIRTSCR